MIHYVAQAGLEWSLILQRLPPKCLTYKSALPHWAAWWRFISLQVFLSSSALLFCLSTVTCMWIKQCCWASNFHGLGFGYLWYFYNFCVIFYFLPNKNKNKNKTKKQNKETKQASQQGQQCFPFFFLPDLFFSLFLSSLPPSVPCFLPSVLHFLKTSISHVALAGLQLTTHIRGWCLNSESSQTLAQCFMPCENSQEALGSHLTGQS